MERLVDLSYKLKDNDEVNILTYDDEKAIEVIDILLHMLWLKQLREFIVMQNLLLDLQ